MARHALNIFLVMAAPQRSFFKAYVKKPQEANYDYIIYTVYYVTICVFCFVQAIRTLVGGDGISCSKIL
jgi:hypothetical protein